MSHQKNNSKTADWHRADIGVALKKKGATLAALARKNGYASNSLQNSLSREWPKAELIIASAIGVSLHEIWPSCYHELGEW